jgi:hypothetical protein
MQPGFSKAKVLERDWDSKLLEQGQKLTTGLSSQLIPTKAFFKSELHKDAEAHFFTMQPAVTCRQLR